MFEELLSKIGASLTANDLPYMVIGGQAVLLYGEPRLTRDIDITLGVDISRLNDLFLILEELALKPIPGDHEVRSFVAETMVLPAVDESSGIRVDFIFSFTPYEKEAIERARKVSLNGQDVFFASPEDLVIHKIFAGRPRDIEDAACVVRRNPKIDVVYIRMRLKEFDVFFKDGKFSAVFEEMMSG